MSILGYNTNMQLAWKYQQFALFIDKQVTRIDFLEIYNELSIELIVVMNLVSLNNNFNPR